MRILLLASRFPWPLFRGDQLTVFKMLEHFGRAHEIDFVSFAPDDPSDIERISDWANRVRVVDAGPAQRITGVTRQFLAGRPLQVGIFWSPEYARAVAELHASGRHDVCFAYYARTAEYLRRLDTTAVRIAGLQLSMALQLERSADRSSNPIKRLFWALEAQAMRRYERRVFDWADAVTLISPKDLLAIKGVKEHPKLVLNPHGVATERYPDHGSEPRERDVVLFTGGLQFEPNQEGVLWFAREVFPLLKREHPNARLRIVGARPPAKIRALADTPCIEVFRDVPSVVPYQVGASVGIVPIHSAGGLQNKLLEGMAAGLPMVSTSVGNEGIGAAPGEELLVADTASEFAQAVGRLMTDGTLAATLGAAGQVFVRRGWSWRGHFDNLEARLEELVASRGPPE